MSPSRRKRTERRVRRQTVRALMRPKLSEQLLKVWDHALWVFANFVEFFATPVAIADREYINVPDYRAMESWLRALELLTRRLILAAALAIHVVLKPLRERPTRAYKRRRVLVWPDRPRTWIARFHMIPRKPPETRFIYRNKRIMPRVLPAMPLARRLEAVRRVLADPETRARRFAATLARIAARNAKANEPRLFQVRAWHPHKAKTRGQRFIRTGMNVVMPLIEDALERWNQRFEPG